jgi:hypothetical protein
MTSPAKEQYETIEVPLAIPLTPYSSMTNFVLTKYENKKSGRLDFHLQRRHGFTSAYSLGVTPSTPYDRGIFVWDKTDRAYTVFGDNLYYSELTGGVGTTSLTSTYTGYSTVYSQAHFTEYFDGTNYFLVTKKTLPTSKAYTINTSSTLTEITDGDYPNTTAIGAFVSMDGYIFVMTTTGFIHNSDLGAPTAWTSTNKIAVTLNPDKGIGLGYHKNQIVAFSTDSIEFFYNAANATGSPLARTDQAAIQGIGCLTAKSIIPMADTLYWISGSGANLGVYKFDGFKPVKVSTEAIDNLLHMLGESFIYYGQCGKLLHHGRELYYVSYGSASTYGVYVYDPMYDEWYIWSMMGGIESGIIPSATLGFGVEHGLSGETYFPVLQSSNAHIHRYNSSTYDDFSPYSNVPTTLHTPYLDFKTTNSIRIKKVTFTVAKQDNTYNYALNSPDNENIKDTVFSVTNLGQYKPGIKIKINQSTDTEDYSITLSCQQPSTVSRTYSVVGSGSYCVIRKVEIQYSIGEH